MRDDITVFVGLDVHKDSIAVALAQAGRSAARFVGTCGPARRDPRLHLHQRRQVVRRECAGHAHLRGRRVLRD